MPAVKVPAVKVPAVKVPAVKAWAGPPGKRMRHAGAISSDGKGTAMATLAALADAGIEIADSPADMNAALVRALRRR